VATTTNLYAVLGEDINPCFCILESVHDDTPPVEQWTSLNEVNLIRGQLNTIESTTRSRKARGNANETVGNSIGGEQVAFKAACLETRNKCGKKWMMVIMIVIVELNLSGDFDVEN